MTILSYKSDGETGRFPNVTKWANAKSLPVFIPTVLVDYLARLLSEDVVVADMV